MFPFHLSKAQAEYDGPEDLRLFADILPYLGELAISFSRLERRVTWAIESLLQTTRDEAHEMEDFVQSFSARIKFLELTGRPVSRETKTEKDFDQIVISAREANTFRNKALHNAFTGIGTQLENGSASVSVRKERYKQKLEQRSYYISTKQFRAETIKNLTIYTEIQRWVLTVRPNAENRVP